MPAQPYFGIDKLETLVRKCIVFPSDGSETHIAHMVARTVTVDDISSLQMYNRCVDMASTYGDEYRMTQVVSCETIRFSGTGTYLFFYNESSNLPINLNIARVVGVSPTQLRTRKRLFWRGDVVAMRVQPESKQIDFIVESLDADLFEMRSLKEFWREQYAYGSLERHLEYDESLWNDYVTHYWWPMALLVGPPKIFWRSAEAEAIFLQRLNERRCTIGRPPIPPYLYTRTYINIASTLYSTLRSTFGLRQKVTGPPKLPPELERQIFETSAMESPEVCTALVLVARRVYTWIDPIMIATVCLVKDYDSKRRNKLKLFHDTLTSGKPANYYARHIKNLAITGIFSGEEQILADRILAFCTGVENLMVFGSRDTLFEFLKDPHAGGNLRRLSIRLESFIQPSGSMPNFYHPCFANLTHLHLWDDDEDWPVYPGWETLTSLTHLALACAAPQQVGQLLNMLQTVRYIAIGWYKSGEHYRHIIPVIDNRPHIRVAWGISTVLVGDISECDWERGARGEGDFWDIVEEEVERRLRELIV